MILTSANMFGIDTPKDLPSYRETMLPSIFATSRGTTDYAWIRTGRHVSHLRLLSLNGPVWSMRLGPCGDAIMFGPWAQWGWGFFGPYNSTPLIRARFLGTNQGTQRAKGLVENSNGQNWVVEASINALSKSVPFLAVRSTVIIIWQFANRNGTSVALNEGLLGFLPLHWEVLCALPIYTPCCAFSSLLPHSLFKFSLCRAHILKAFLSPSL